MTTTSGAGLAAVAGLVAGLAGGVAISGGDSVELATPPPAISSVEVVPAHLRQVVDEIAAGDPFDGERQEPDFRQHICFPARAAQPLTLSWACRT